MKQTEIDIAAPETISLTDVCAAMGISKSALRSIRDPASTHYLSFFPKALERTELQVFFPRKEIVACLKKLSDTALTGVDPLAPRPKKKAGRKPKKVIIHQKLEVILPTLPKHLSPAMIENIRSNVLYSLFGCDFFYFTALNEAVRLSGMQCGSLLAMRKASLYKYHGVRWNTITDREKGAILTVIRLIFFTMDGDPHQEWKGSICSELNTVLDLLSSDKNFIAKWWERRHPNNLKYKQFLKNS